MSRVELTKELYGTLRDSLADIPSEKPVAVQANHLRALLRAIDPGKLPAEQKDDVPDDAPPAAK